MKTILATTYAVNPYKGSEDGMGWNMVKQIARFNKVIAITRENNRPHIEKYMAEFPDSLYQHITFLYFDLPYYQRFWKKGQRGAMLYFYLWQKAVVSFVKKQQLQYDIVHNLNFHNDWTPSFLWKLNKPFVWGPVGHHPPVPYAFIKQYPLQELIKDRFTWFVKKLFWKLSPSLKNARNKASIIIAMNSSVNKQLKADAAKVILTPSVSSEAAEEKNTHHEVFRVMSAGRFVPLKGFDITIRAFASFYHSLNEYDKKRTELILVGDGPYRSFLEKLISNLGLNEAVKIIRWVNRSEMGALYSSSSVFLFPSHEGAGMVVAEALANSLPVICFNNCGPGEFIDNTCGIKVDYSPYDIAIKKFSLALSELKYNPTRTEQLAAGARNKFTKTFNWNVKGIHFNHIYKKLSA